MITLTIGPTADQDPFSLSGIAPAGEHLFLAPDEGSHILRLTRRDESHYDRPTAYPLQVLLRLPGAGGGGGGLADLEGLARADGYLWCVASHSAVRKRVKPGASPDKVAQDLLDVSYPAERRVLGRIPIAADGCLVRSVPAHGGNPARTAAILGDTPGPGLREVLAEDPYLGP